MKLDNLPPKNICLGCYIKARFYKGPLDMNAFMMLAVPNPCFIAGWRVKMNWGFTGMMGKTGLSV